MLTIYLLVLGLLIWGFSFCGKSFNSDYIGKDQCNAVKGIFILFVFVRHIIPYMKNAGCNFSYWGDDLCLVIDKSLGQLIVVMFLFYSGYGVMESIKRKGTAYIDAMPKNRILRTLGNFDISVTLFIILDLVLGIKYDWMQTILAFTGWTSVGNSYWYIFDILVCYSAVWVSFKYGKWWMSLVLIGIAFVILKYTKESWWYNTILSFPTGILYSKFKHKIEPVFQANFWPLLLLSLIVFFFLYKLPIFAWGIKDNAMSIAFVALCIMCTMKVKLGNDALRWLGKNLFPLYIYQRIPMIMFSSLADGMLPREYPLCFVFVCAVITLLFGRFFKNLSLPNYS